MEIPSRHRDHRSGGLPSIFVDDDFSFSPSTSSRGGFGASNMTGRPGFHSFNPQLGSSIPMPIPNARNPADEPPPPLPPPRYAPIEGPTAEPTCPEYEPRNHDMRADSAISTGSGYFGSLNGNFKREMQWSRNDGDEGYGSISSSGFGSVSSMRSQNSIPARFGVHHERYQFRPTVNAYDTAQLQKLNSRRSLNNRSPPQRSSLSSMISSSAGEATGFGHVHQHSSTAERLSLKPVSLPTRTKQQPSLSMLDSPSRFTETPLNSATSPRSAPFGRSPDHRSPSSEPGSGETERSPMADDAAAIPTRSARGSYDMGTMMDDGDFPMEETTRLHGIHIDDQVRPDFYGAGQKRRASSPLGGDDPWGTSMSSSMELSRRRDGMPSRGSPTPRLTAPSAGVSSALPSAPSISGRGGSLISSISLAANMSSYGGRRSPVCFTPSGAVSPTEPSSCGSPFGTPMSLNVSSPQSSSATSRASMTAPVPHNRSPSDQDRQQQPAMSPRKLSDMSKSNVAKLQGFFMCDCCPKKPKKFDTQEELSQHEAEKQYECQFCGNRFKNKNEAERHQNSLHVRRHSWSCSALSSWGRAFHESTNLPGQADTCGYCGREFVRTGPPSRGSTAWVATEQDWTDRVHHLTEAHKFRECNASKKFYRADHFRQHLKHSHAGTSGKWTNMLENACMMEEEPPMPMSMRMAHGSGVR